MDMKRWISALLDAPVKKAMPVLSFPCVSLMGVTALQLVNSSELQARGMKLIADRTDAAASLSMMDLSVEAEAFGSEIKFAEDEVPTVVGRIIEDEEGARSLRVPEVGEGRTGVYVEAIRRASELIADRPVFGGIIGPLSLAGRLMDVSEALINCYEDPDMVKAALEKATEFLIKYAKAYKAAGANGIVMAEPLTGLMSPALAEEFSEPYVRRVFEAVQDDEFVAIYHNCGGNTPLMTQSICRTGADAFHFGNAVSMADLLAKMPEDVPVMGNVDPAGQFCNGTPESVRKATLKLMELCGKHKNFVISSGCDIPPATPWENIDAFFEAVRDFYAR